MITSKNPSTQLKMKLSLALEWRQHRWDAMFLQWYGGAALKTNKTETNKTKIPTTHHEPTGTWCWNKPGSQTLAHERDVRSIACATGRLSCWNTCSSASAYQKMLAKRLWSFYDMPRDFQGFLHLKKENVTDCLAGLKNKESLHPAPNHPEKVLCQYRSAGLGQKVHLVRALVSESSKFKCL